MLHLTYIQTDNQQSIRDRLTHHHGFSFTSATCAEPAFTTVAGRRAEAGSLAVLTGRAHQAGRAVSLGGQRVVGARRTRVLSAHLRGRWAVVTDWTLVLCRVCRVERAEIALGTAVANCFTCGRRKSRWCDVSPLNVSNKSTAQHHYKTILGVHHFSVSWYKPFYILQSFH